MMNRSKLAECRAAIYRTEHHGGPHRVFAQIQAQGSWQPVQEIKQIRKLLWVRINGAMYMAHDVKLMD